MKTAETGLHEQSCAALPDWLHNRISEAQGMARDPVDRALPTHDLDPIDSAMLDGIYAKALALDVEGVARISKAFPSGAIREAVLRQTIARIEEGWQTDGLGIIEASNAFWTVERAIRRAQIASAPKDDWATQKAIRVLLYVPQDEDHTFGAQLLCDQMRAKGLSVKLKLREPKSAVYEALEVEAVDMLAISLGYDHSLLGLPQLIHDARIVSSNPKLAVALGGQVFSAPPVDYGFLNADIIVKPDADPVAQMVRFLEEKILVSGLHDG